LHSLVFRFIMTGLLGGRDRGGTITGISIDSPF
jgi:hypothetical protein